MTASQLSSLNVSAQNVSFYVNYMNDLPAASTSNSRTIMQLEASLHRCCALIVGAMQ
jgi:hypothetical protein